MATHTLAILVKALGTAKASKDLKGVDASISRIGATAGKGLRTAAGNIAKLGAAGLAIGAGIAAVNIKSGVESLAILESAVTSVDGAIRQMGLTGKVTGANVAGWANEIEASVGAAFDDKDITAATATLIRFGKTTPANLKPAMVVMTDLATKTGSVDSAASLLAKALADPEKAAGKLARSGVILTKQQQAQIKAFMKAGQLGKAQKVILDSLAKSTKGAAAASQGPYARAMATLRDTTEDAQRALAEGFLPVLIRASDWLKTKMADPATIANIRSLGQNLANAFSSAIDFAEKVDWNSVGAGLKVAAAAAKGLFDAFMSLPPEVKGTLLALGGLNKISGGAITDIAGELGKGLIKGVLGMNAAVVNLNAAVVNNKGLPNTPGGGGTGGGAGKGGKITPMEEGPVGNKPGVVGLIVASALVVKGDTPGMSAATEIKQLHAMLEQGMGNSQWGAHTGAGGGSESVVQAIRRLEGKLPGSFAQPGTVKNDPTGFLNTPAAQKITTGLADTRSEQIMTTKAVDAVKVKQGETLAATTSGAARTAMAAASAGIMGAFATAASAGRIVAAISANRPVQTTSVVVNITAANVTKTVTVSNRTGNRNGSAGSNGSHKNIDNRS